jgi:hypothetical protein
VSKLTPWFSGSVMPVRVGIYERRNTNQHHRAANGYATWDGRQWARSVPTIESYSGVVSMYQPHIDGGRDFEWRGLTKESTK